VQLIYREFVFELVEPTSIGRSFDGSSVIRLGDSSPGGRARLDAIARLLQDVSDDDARAAGFGEYTWVVRRTVIAVHQFPAYLEPVSLRTWCSGFGAAWAERRISMRGDIGGRLESATLWVHLDPGSMRPARMPRDFLDVFGPSADGRPVSAKPRLSSPPDDAGTPWPVRFADFDVLEHVNNAMYFAPVEESLARRRSLRAPMNVVVEHGDPIERGDVVRWVERDGIDGGFDGWLVGSTLDGAGRQFAAVSVVPGV
jgi:acyl-ACP thioesterase